MNRQCKTKHQKHDFKAFARNNIIGLILLLASFTIMINQVHSYKWMWESLIYKNLINTWKYHDLKVKDKHEIKHGYYYTYLNFINSKTPEDAVILMPPDSVINSTDPKYKLSFLKDRKRTTYFLYPRKPVYEKDIEFDAEELKNITHIAIVNYFGYNKLNYLVDPKPQFTVAPIKIQ